MRNPREESTAQHAQADQMTSKEMSVMLRCGQGGRTGGGGREGGESHVEKKVLEEEEDDDRGGGGTGLPQPPT